MNTSNYPNRDALRKALDIYLDAMHPFIVRCLNQIPGETAEDIIEKTCGKDTVECKDIAYLFRNYWDPFEKHFDRIDRYYEARSVVQLIVEGRNRASHPPWDLAPEFTQTQLFMIAELLGKINKPEKQREVLEIRDALFSDDIKERLAEAEKRIMEIESEKIEHEKIMVELSERLSETEERLKEVESEKHEYEKSNRDLSQQMIDNALKIEDTSKQLNEAKSENAKYKKNLAEINKKLEKSEVSVVDYKKRFETESKELKDTQAELLVSKENLADASSQLTAMQGEKEAVEERLATVKNQLEAIKTERKSIEERIKAMRNLLNTVTIDNQMVKPVLPPLSTDSTVRILDHRNTNKKNYLLGLLELKQPSIIYVLNEEKINLFLTDVVGPERAKIIGKHNEQTSDAEETELLEKLENGDLIAIVTDATFSKLPEQHCVEHFVFCHLSHGINTFFTRCQPAFTSHQSAYLHLIYDCKQEMKRITQKYPDREALEKFYTDLKDFIGTNKNFVKTENIREKLNLAKLELESGCDIFEELGLLKKSSEGIKLLPPVGKKLEESKVFCDGRKLMSAMEFQTSDIVQIWEKIVEKLDVDPELCLQNRNIHSKQYETSEIGNNDQQPTADEKDTIISHSPAVWPQRTFGSFASLRQFAAKNFSESNTLLREEDKQDFSDFDTRDFRSSLCEDLESSLCEDLKRDNFLLNQSYKNCYNLAMQFLEDHGINALKQGVAELIQDQDDPDYDFTEDETTMLQAFQDALNDFQ